MGSSVRIVRATERSGRVEECVCERMGPRASARYRLLGAASRRCNFARVHLSRLEVPMVG